jgi:competence protein ComEA
VKRPLKNFFREYLSFTLQERKAIYIFITLILLLLIAPKLYQSFHTKSDNLTNTNYSAFDSAFKKINSEKDSTIKPIISPFNPNTYSANDWTLIGVKPRIAANIEKYIQKGGKFKHKNDLLKIYGFDSSLYYTIEPFIQIPNIDTIKKITKPAWTSISINKTATIKNEVVKTEINSADSSELESLYGIGPALAGRIIKYRTLLGGFNSKEQLTEVYGFTSTQLEKISRYIYVDTSKIIKLELTTNNKLRIQKHPYINRYKASILNKYIKFNKQVKNSSELIQNNIFTEQELINLKPYLKFE